MDTLTSNLLTATTLDAACEALLKLAQASYNKETALSPLLSSAVVERLEWHHWRHLAVADNTTGATWLSRCRRVFGMTREQLDASHFIGDSLCTLIESHIKDKRPEVDEESPSYWDFGIRGRLKEWEGVQIPVLHNYSTMWTATGKASRVPLRYYEGCIEAKTLEDKQLDHDCLDFTYMIYGTESESKQYLAECIVHLREVAKAFGYERFHFATRTLNSDHPIFAGKNVTRFILFRIYRNADFKCIEHPEMLLGCPLGMYHCPECGAMQVAGLPHVAEE